MIVHSQLVCISTECRLELSAYGFLVAFETLVLYEASADNIHGQPSYIYTNAKKVHDNSKLSVCSC